MCVPPGPAVRSIDSGGDNDFLDSNLVDDAALGVDLGRDDAASGVGRVLQRRRRSDCRRSSLAARLGGLAARLGGLAGLSNLERVGVVRARLSGSLDVVHADAVAVLGTGWRVGLCRNRRNGSNADTA